MEQGIPPAQDIPDYPLVTSRESPRPFLGMRGKPGCPRCEAAAAAGFGFVDTGTNPGISGVGRDLKAHPIPQGTPSTGPMWTNPTWMNPAGPGAADSAWNGSGAREWDVPALKPGNSSRLTQGRSPRWAAAAGSGPAEPLGSAIPGCHTRPGDVTPSVTHREGGGRNSELSNPIWFLLGRVSAFGNF